ncbi:MAG: SigB/SigF/SigG family RNA polymerase sigma factor [Clostridia bacterium]|nr:SigB/SigF/SigG family RNA polymerase sigma factor [Clostridia bacterium]
MDDNPALLEKISTGDKAAFDKMVEANLGLVRSVARLYTGRGCDIEDLIQIGAIGLMKAIRRFDKSFGVKFSTYAVPMISGEIRRFLRDDGILKVSRSVREKAAKGRNAQEQLRKQSGREPTIGEIAAKSGISSEELVYAFEACSCCESLNEYIADSGEEREDRLCEESHEEDTINRIWITNALSALEPRERQIIILRYLKGKTQTDIAGILGISQVQVSRIEKKTIGRIRELMTMQA